MSDRLVVPEELLITGRRTGKTTKLVQRALEIPEAVVVVADRDSARRLEGQGVARSRIVVAGDPGRLAGRKQHVLADDVDRLPWPSWMELRRTSEKLFATATEDPAKFRREYPTTDVSKSGDLTFGRTRSSQSGRPGFPPLTPPAPPEVWLLTVMQVELRRLTPDVTDAAFCRTVRQVLEQEGCQHVEVHTWFDSTQHRNWIEVRYEEDGKRHGVKVFVTDERLAREKDGALMETIRKIEHSVKWARKKRETLAGLDPVQAALDLVGFDRKEIKRAEFRREEGKVELDVDLHESDWEPTFEFDWSELEEYALERQGQRQARIEYVADLRREFAIGAREWAILRPTDV